MKMLGVIALAAALPLLPARASAESVQIMGNEAMGLVTRAAGDGSVSHVATAAFDGLVVDVEAGNRALSSARFTMTIVIAGDELRSATIVYTQSGRRATSVTVTIDPCWFEMANERDFTAEDFGVDVREKVAAALPGGVLDPAIAKWLDQRLALLAARIAAPDLKAGVVLVPPRS